MRTLRQGYASILLSRRLLSLAPGRRPGGHLDLPAADKELPGWPIRSRNVTACGAMPLLIRRYDRQPGRLDDRLMSRRSGRSAPDWSYGLPARGRPDLPKVVCPLLRI